MKADTDVPGVLNYLMSSTVRSSGIPVDNISVKSVMNRSPF